MKLYKDNSNNVYAYEADGSQDDSIPPAYTAITQAEADIILTPVLEYSNEISSLTFFNRFTPPEQTAVVTATLASVPLKIFYDKMMAANFVDITNAETVAGVDALIGAGLVDASRKDALLAQEVVA